MRPTMQWTETVTAKVKTLTLVGHEKNQPFGWVVVEVQKSAVGFFHTSFLADLNAFQTAIDCFKNNELIEFKGDFESHIDIVKTTCASDVRKAEEK
ncbi:MAG: hypothetical protein IJU03_01045 [Thermoguttaceae bacterium]|nr:hypothetical protein [Thermoguttaceae bacterium]